MKKILLIKTSSLGDVIHAFPAVTDLKAAGVAARIDWVVEESLVPIVKLHPAVDDVIAVAMRRWRCAWWRRRHALISSRIERPGSDQEDRKSTRLNSSH